MSGRTTNPELLERLKYFSLRTKRLEQPTTSTSNTRRRRRRHTTTSDTQPSTHVSSPQVAFRFLDLPVELAVRILRHVDGIELARFQTISKGCRDLVQGSLELQYAIERTVCEVTDAPQSKTYTLRDRLDSLRQWKRAQTNAHFDDLITVQGGSEYESCRTYRSTIAYGYGGYGMERTRFEFHRVGSRLRGTTAASWTLDGLPPFEAFMFDDDQDLLVLLDGFDDRTNLDIHLRTCSTGEVHPLAPEKMLDIQVHMCDPEGLWTFDVAIAGDLVGFLASHDWARGNDRVHNEIWVYNWKTGDRLLNIEGEDIAPNDLAFLDDRHIVVTSIEQYAQNIHVYDCLAFPRRRKSMVKSVNYAALVLRMPDVLPGRCYDYVAVKSSPILPGGIHSSEPAKFAWACQSPIILVSITIGPEEERNFELVIPARTILSRIKDRPARQDSTPIPISWDEWGEETRLFEMPNMLTSGSICGSRYAIVDDWSPGFDIQANEGVIIYDFDSVPSLWRSFVSTDAATKHPVRLSLFPWPDYETEVWTEELVTSAPCRVTMTGIVADEWARVLLVEDGVVLPSRASEYDREELKIYTS